MNTRIFTWHGQSKETDAALDAVSAVKLDGNSYETEMELFEAVRILSANCRTVGIFSNKEETDHWLAITTYRNFSQR